MYTVQVIIAQLPAGKQEEMPLKIMHLIAGGDSGGAKTHLLDLLPRLAETESVTLVCLGDGVLAREAMALGLEVKLLTGGFFAALRSVERLAQAADILHCHGSRANLTGALAKGSLRCPVISTVHSDHTLDYLDRPAARLTYGALNAWALRRMDALFCVSEAMKGLYARRGFDPERLYAVYNGVDFDAPAVRVDRQDWFAKLGFAVAAGDVVIGCAARFHPVKDLPTLLRGFASAAKADPRLKLLLAGAGGEEARLRVLAQELDVAERVCFPGWLEDMEGFYAAIDAAALTSRSETFPYALSHAARYGKPVAATAVGGIPELVEDAVSGFLLPVGDAQALAGALTALCDGPLRQRLGEALQTRAKERFSLAATVEGQRRAYLAVLERVKTRFQ